MTVGAVPGVTILGGQATFGSSDGSIEFEGGPAQGQVDAKVTGGPVLRTLSAIYAFGLADAPVADNFFDMPPGPLAFEGATTWGARSDCAVVFAQQKTQVDLSSPPGYQRIQIAANLSGSGGGGNGFFSIFELNDPAWNGAFGSLGGPWDLERIAFSNDPNHGIGHHTTIFAQRQYDTFAQSPFIVPSGPRVNEGMDQTVALYNDFSDAVLQVQSLNAFGMIEELLFSRENGQNAQLVTHWQNHAAAPAAGDGPCWVVDGDGRFGRFAPRAAVGFQQTTASVDDAWQATIALWDGAAWATVATWDPQLGQNLSRGGLQLPKVDSTTFPVSNAQSARLVWDDTLQKVMISVDAAAYVALSTFA